MSKSPTSHAEPRQLIELSTSHATRGEALRRSDRCEIVEHVRIGYNRAYNRTQPHPIDPEALRITSPILAFVAEVDECKGTWRALRDLAPKQLAALRHVATIESIGSSTTIERARLSDQQVEWLPQGLDTNAFRSRDEEECSATTTMSGARQLG